MYGHMPEVILPREDQGIHITRSEYFISADLGQANDYTAISILERVTKGPGVLDDVSYHLRHLERPARGTEYPAIVDRLIELYRSPQLLTQNKAVVIDLTGLGRPVYDMMRKAGFRNSLNAISITGGDTVNHVDGHINVPKRHLISNLQIMLQNNVFKIAKGIKEADALIEELANFQVRISATGHDTYGGRSGVHDDLVLSVAMGAWLAQRRHCRMGRGEVL